MTSRKIKIFLIFALMALALPATSYSGNFFDFFRGGASDSGKLSNSPISGKEDLSPCGKQIEIFRKFMHDGRICKKDDDCISMDGICPLGCKFYLNKNFAQIIQTEMGKVQDICTDSVCSYKCSKINIQPVCRQNRCQARNN